jgi:Spy/CpxP family protein refolding chaperone
VSARSLAALVVTVAHVTGVVLGIAADRWLLIGHFGRRRVPPSFAAGPHGMFGGPQREPRDNATGNWITQQMARTLGDLTPAQQARIDSILTRRIAQRRELEAPIRDRMRAIIDSTRSDVDSVLTPDQRKRLAEVRSHSRFGPPPPPPGADDVSGSDHR